MAKANLNSGREPTSEARKRKPLLNFPKSKVGRQTNQTCF
uniref:Uncharacterized protein n=1 Tax=Arundo donax TaxID=35708 RepID=A0A0A9B8V4_ARUDO